MATRSTGLTAAAVRSAFFEAYRTRDRTSIYQRVAHREPSDRAWESYRWIGQVPMLRRFGDGRLARDMSNEQYDVANEKYEATIQVDRDEIDDDQTGQIRQRIGEMAGAAASHKDYLISQLLIYGATAGYIGYDGLTFFNDAHYIFPDAPATIDNDLTAAIVDKDAPTTAEAKAAFRTAMSAMMGWADEKGNPIGQVGDQFLVIVPPGPVWHAMREARGADIISSTTNVDMELNWDVVLFPWLSDTDTWYMLRVNRATKPFLFQDRAPIEFSSLEDGSDEAFMKERYLYGVRARYAITYMHFIHALRYVWTTA